MSENLHIKSSVVASSEMWVEENDRQNFNFIFEFLVKVLYISLYYFYNLLWAYTYLKIKSEKVMLKCHDQLEMKNKSTK